MEKSKELLKRFLTFDVQKDWDDPKNREKYANMFRDMVLSDDPDMQKVIGAMMGSFAKQNDMEQIVGDEDNYTNVDTSSDDYTDEEITDDTSLNDMIKKMGEGFIEDMNRLVV